MSKTINELLEEFAISHRIGIFRYESSEARKIIYEISKIDKTLAANLASKLVGVSLGNVRNTTTKKIESIIKSVTDERAKSLESIFSDFQESTLPEYVAYEGQFNTNMLNKAIFINEIAAVAPSVEQMDSILTLKPFEGRYLSEYFDAFTIRDKQKITAAIRQGYILGEDINKITNRVTGTKNLNYKDGVLLASRREAETLVRTSISHAADVARQAVFNENKSFIKVLQYSATLDGRTTPICRSRDGKTYEVGKQPPLPAHWGCRSTYLPRATSADLLGNRPYITDTRTRKNMQVDFKKLAKENGTTVSYQRNKWGKENIGTIKASTDYNTWLRKQNATFQDDVLGQAKGKIYRANPTMKLDKFVDTAGNELTLKELKARDSQLFKNADL